MRRERSAFGDLLRQFRIGAALSQEALAERAGLSRRGISDLERGVSVAPRLETVRLLADALALGERDQQALLTAARPELHARASGRLSAIRVALPSPLTRLIGREAELAALRAALDHDEVRLLTQPVEKRPGSSAAIVGPRLERWVKHRVDIVHTPQAELP